MHMTETFELIGSHNVKRQNFGDFAGRIGCRTHAVIEKPREVSIFRRVDCIPFFFYSERNQIEKVRKIHRSSEGGFFRRYDFADILSDEGTSTDRLPCFHAPTTIAGLEDG